MWTTYPYATGIWDNFETISWVLSSYISILGWLNHVETTIFDATKLSSIWVVTIFHAYNVPNIYIYIYTIIYVCIYIYIIYDICILCMYIARNDRLGKRWRHFYRVYAICHCSKLPLRRQGNTSSVINLLASCGETDVFRIFSHLLILGHGEQFLLLHSYLKRAHVYMNMYYNVLQ